MDGSSAAQLAADSGGRPVVKQQRKNNFYLEEKELLVSLIERHAGVLESQEHKRAGGKSKQRAAAWDDIHRRFNDTNRSGPERSVSELKRCYNNLKQRIKKVLDARREAPAKACSIKMDDRLLSRIMQLAPEDFGRSPDLHGERVGTSESDSKDLMDIKTEDGESAIVKQEDALDDCSFEVQPGPGVIKAEFDDDHDDDDAYETHSKEDEPSDSREDESPAVKLEPFEDETHSKEDEPSDSREDESAAVKLEPFEGPVPIVKDEPMDDAHEDVDQDIKFIYAEEFATEEDQRPVAGPSSAPSGEDSHEFGTLDGASDSRCHSGRRRVRTAHSETGTGTLLSEDDDSDSDSQPRKPARKRRKQAACRICGYVFGKVKVMETHVRKYHPTMKVYECRICSKGYMTSSAYSEHARSHSLDNVYECHICKKIFRKNYVLQKHLQSHEKNRPEKNRPNRPRPRECLLCGKTFLQVYELRRHTLIHMNARAHTCDTCGKGFVQKGDLVRHYRIHTAENPYKCDICHRTFSRKDVLTNHILTHTGERPYKCELCTRSFSRKDAVAIHMKEHIDLPEFRCAMCGSAFATKRRLRLHNKKYKCKGGTSQNEQRSDT